jgi:hypothetical protein
MSASRKILPALCVGLSILFASCVSVAHYEAIDQDVARGDFAAGRQKVEEAKGKEYRDNDTILYLLDAGLLSHYSGDYANSSKELGTAERAIEEAFTKSITNQASSYLVNDTTLEYPGEDYEDIYLNVFNALNYYHSGSTEGALVEIRRVDNKLKNLSTKYGTEISNAQKSVMAKSSDVPYDPATTTVNFSNSALGRYLGMLFYRAEGKSDDARIDRDQVKLAFANQPNVYKFGLPPSLDDELSVPKGKARLNVISFNGLSPIKEDNTIRIPTGGGHWLKITVPVIVRRPSAIARTEVVLDSGERFNLAIVEDLGAVAEETFKQKAGLIYLKTVLRSIAKTTASAVLDERSDDVGGDAGIALALLSIGTQVYAEASEQADLRMSRYFPSEAVVGGVNLDPGLYSFTVNYYNRDNGIAYSRRFTNVEVKANKLNLTEAVCIK